MAGKQAEPQSVFGLDVQTAFDAAERCVETGVYVWIIAALLKDVKDLKGRASFLESCKMEIPIIIHQEGKFGSTDVVDEAGEGHIVEVKWKVRDAWL